MSADTTKTAVERVGAVFTDLPIHPDDVQSIKKEVLDAIIYMIGNGKGRMRGAKAGGTQELVTLRTVGLFTSEKNVLTDTSLGGQGMRVIETKGGLGSKSVEAAEAIISFLEGVKGNYGVFAPVFIRYVISHQKEIKKLHRESTQTIENSKSKYAMNNDMVNIAGRMTGIFASILTAGKIFEMLYEEMGGAPKDPEKLVVTMFEKNVQIKSAESYALKGLNHIMSWVAANRSYFLNNGEREEDNKGNKKQYFLEKGLLNLDKPVDGKIRRQKSIWLEGSVVRMVSFKLDATRMMTTDSGLKEGNK